MNCKFVGGIAISALVFSVSFPAFAQDASSPIVRRPILRPVITPPAPVATGMADLIVDAVRVEVKSVFADVRNGGTVASTPTDITLFAGPQTLPLRLLALQPGERRTIRFALPAGATRVQVMADRGALVAELSETNNRLPAIAVSAASVQAAAAPTAADAVAAGPRPPLARLPAPVAPKPTPTATVASAPTSATLKPLPKPILDILPPTPPKAKAPSSAVVIDTTGSTSAAVKAMSAVRKFSLSSLRANPVVEFGQTKGDFRPVLNNPQALFNVAERLRAQPLLAEVLLDTTDTVEIGEGVAMHNRLAYRLRPGACATAQMATAVVRAGLSCTVRLSAAARAAASANPADARYIADPTKRANALKTSELVAANAKAKIDSHIVQLRAQLASPGPKAELGSIIGSADVARLSALSDDQLADEMANSGITRIEQIMYVPKFEASPSSQVINGLVSQSGKQPAVPWAAIGAAVANAKGKPPTSATQKIDDRVFLTGFTLGRNYEWRQRVETTIAWCVVGCEETYYGEVYAGFGYQMGLRFPLAVSGTYNYANATGSNASASVKLNLTPVNGSAADYASTGLAADKVATGKELVAAMGAYAGLNYDLPVVGSGGAGFNIDYDLTKELPAPFTNGQFLPPAPGKPMAPVVKLFDTLDLAGGVANFGVAGAKVFPQIKAQLQSDALRFTLHDTLSGKDTIVDASGKAIALSVNPKDQSSSFALGNPEYTLSFLLTPGLVARLFVDVGVWSNNWDWPVWLPQLEIKLPPGGTTFSCHSGTECTRNYRYGPTLKEESKGETAAIFVDEFKFKPGEVPAIGQWTKLYQPEIEKLAQAYDARWIGKCKTETCYTLIRSSRIGMQKTLYSIVTKSVKPPIVYPSVLDMPGGATALKTSDIAGETYTK